MHTTQKQPVLRFAHPSGVLSTSQWRQGLKASKHLAGIDLDMFAVNQSDTAFSFTARTPQAGQAIDERVMDFMRATANVVNKTLDVQKLDLTPDVANTKYRWFYKVPKWVVARPSKTGTKDAWSGWRQEALSPEIQQEMLSRLGTDLKSQLELWTQGCPDLELAIEDYGRPMVLKDAIANGPKSVSVMARLDVTFSSSRRIEGAFYTGLFNVLGFGRIFRNGYQEQQGQE